MAHMVAFCPVIWNTELGEYRPDISGCDWRRLGPVDSDGNPRFDWDLVILKDNANSDPANVTGDNILVFPVVPDMETMTVGEIPAAKRTEINDWLTTNGYDTSWITGATLVREVFVEVLYYLTGEEVSKTVLRNWVRKMGGLIG